MTRAWVVLRLGLASRTDFAELESDWGSSNGSQFVGAIHLVANDAELGGRFLALGGLSRARRDGLYRIRDPLTTSKMAGRDFLPATPSDSGTHAQRAHAYREQQNTPFMRLRHASGSTLQHPRPRSRHANKACMCSAHAPWLQRKPQTMHPCSFPRPVQLPDARSAPSAPRAHSRHRHAMRAGARAQHCKGG